PGLVLLAPCGCLNKIIQIIEGNYTDDTNVVKFDRRPQTHDRRQTSNLESVLKVQGVTFPEASRQQ
ncbi:MAG: hypothetical protein AB1801_14470, partial [Chloroflexota bacterium]